MFELLEVASGNGEQDPGTCVEQAGVSKQATAQGLTHGPVVPWRIGKPGGSQASALADLLSSQDLLKWSKATLSLLVVYHW